MSNVERIIAESQKLGLQPEDHVFHSTVESIVRGVIEVSQERGIDAATLEQLPDVLASEFFQEKVYDSVIESVVASLASRGFFAKVKQAKQAQAREEFLEEVREEAAVSEVADIFRNQGHKDPSISGVVGYVVSPDADCIPDDAVKVVVVDGHLQAVENEQGEPVESEPEVIQETDAQREIQSSARLQDSLERIGDNEETEESYINSYRDAAKPFEKKDDGFNREKLDAVGEHHRSERSIPSQDDIEEEYMETLQDADAETNRDED